MRIPRSRMRGINNSDTYRNQQFDIDAGNTVGLSHGLRTPATPLDPMPISSDDVPDLDLGPASHVGSYFRSVGAVEKGPGGVPQVVVDIGAPPSAFHYQLKKPIRVPYMEEKVCCTLLRRERSAGYHKLILHSLQVHSQFRTHIYGFTVRLAPREIPSNDIDHSNAHLSVGGPDGGHEAPKSHQGRLDARYHLGW